MNPWEESWDTKAVKLSFDDALKAEGVTGKAADIARSIYQQESGSGKNTKTSNAGAVGGMQIIPATFKSVADKDWDITDPFYNSRAGIRYVKQLFEKAGGDPALTAAGYYGGPGGLEKARRGVAVSDPRNPNAPTTLEYGQQVAARLPKESASAPVSKSPAAKMPWEEEWESPAAPQRRAGAEGSRDEEPIAAKRERTIPERAINAIARLNPLGGLVDMATGGEASIGAARGVKDIVDTGASLLSRLGGSGEAARVRSMNEAGKEDFERNFGDSTAASVGRVAGNVAGTWPVGGALGGAARVAGSPRLANALASGGFTVGGAPAATMRAAASNMGVRMAGGAGTGAASAALVDPNSAATGGVVGAALPPVARVAGAAGGALQGAGRAVADMATQGGQNRIAANILQRTATNPQQAAANLLRARPVVPGSNPTMGQAAQDPGLAQLERTFINNPEMAPALQQRFAQQRAARTGAIDEIAATAPGSGSYYDDINEGRRIFANEDYAAARNAGVDPEMAASMQAEIASLMERPSIQAAIGDARRLAAETGENITDLGSVQGLDWVKKALDNQISRANRGNSSIGAEDLRALRRTRDDLNATLEQLAPAYREANRNYAAMSRQINSMDVARELDRSYTPAAANFGPTAKEQGNAFMKALHGAQDSVRRATGREQDLGQTMSTADIFALENVGRDLARKQYAESAGSAVGSPTAQNMLSQHFINRVLADAGVPQSVISGVQGSTIVDTLLRPVEFAGRLALPRVQNRLAELALSPEQAALALQQAQQRVPRNLLSLPGPLAELPFRAAPAISAR